MKRATRGLLVATLVAGVALVVAYRSGDVRSYQSVREAWRSSEAVLLDRHGAVLHTLRTDLSLRRLAWTPLTEVSPALVRAVVYAEDRRYYRHHGVDARALAAALLGALGGERSRGASTITMQLAALLDPALAGRRNGRSLRQKLAQLRAAWLLERDWDKQQVLEAYLNQVSFRGELQGIAAAARALLGKSPAGLDPLESVLMAALLPAPNAAPATVARRACALAAQLRLAVNCADIQRLAAAVLTRGPRLALGHGIAPHLAQLLLRIPGERLHTTLDARIQTIVHEALAGQLLGLAVQNVRDGAALVIDNAEGSVLAYVGSAGPYSRAAQVDGVRARRQAGSTLKPFLYGLALERRYLTAASLLNDSPINLETPVGLYVPQNYERDFKGLVSVRTALAGSLNIPAVQTLRLTGIEPFRARLFDLGYRGIARPGEYYGYSLALGSAEVSLIEQAQAYRALANGGWYRPVRFRADARGPPARRVMSTASAFLVADILSDAAGRSVTFGLDSPLATPFWSAVKTGTSKDMRDNWCIGFSRRYTVAVWVGNFEGDAMQRVSGVTGAAPVWLSIMAHLHRGGGSDPPRPPQALVQRTVRFDPPIEAARSEWFLAGTDSTLVRVAPSAQRPPRIVAPPDGLTVALDPDIPPARQWLVLQAEGSLQGARLRLDNEVPLDAAQPHRWQPRAGRHTLRLEGPDGAIHDQAQFVVRAAKR
ncbi:MAG: penicillin-binding protein 1C [Gammaproteobacteria bacterium]